MFFGEDWDVEEGAVAVEFYPCTVVSMALVSLLPLYIRMSRLWLSYLFNLILDICFNEYATIASGS